MGSLIRRVRVLCVDDNEDSAETMALLLGLLGFDARACYDGSAALAVAAEFQPDVCLLDINMPAMDGHELAGRLRDRCGGRPLLLVAATARSADGERDRTTAAGFHYHLTKPVDIPALLGAMTEFAGSRWGPRPESARAAAAS